MSKYGMAAKRILEVVMAMIMMTSILGCAEFMGHTPTAGTYEGPVQTMGGGQARAFITLNDSGKPTTIGIRMSDTALSGNAPRYLHHNMHIQS